MKWDTLYQGVGLILLSCALTFALYVVFFVEFDVLQTSCKIAAFSLADDSRQQTKKKSDGSYGNEEKQLLQLDVMFNDYLEGVAVPREGAIILPDQKCSDASECAKNYSCAKVRQCLAFCVLVQRS